MRPRRTLVLLLLTAVSRALGGPALEPPPNPHWRTDACSQCHGPGDPEAIAPEESEVLCVECHDPTSVAAHIHPLSIAPGPLAEPMRVRDVPLLEDKITCLSCHDLLLQCEIRPDVRSANRMFLRGPGGGDVAASCFLCHPEEPFARYDPHSQVAEDGSLRHDQCLFCHETELDPQTFRRGDALNLRAAPRRLCNNCHRIHGHPRGVDHLVTVDDHTVDRMLSFELADRLRGMTPGQISRYLAAHPAEPLLLPLGAEREISCSTCHNPHERGVIPISNPLSSGAESKPVASHRLRMDAEALCLACHDM